MKTRNLRFLVTVISVLLLLYVYMAWSLGRGLEHPGVAWFLVLIPVLGIITYPVIYFASRRKTATNPRPSVPQWIAYISMATASFLLPLVLLRDLFALLFHFISPANETFLLGGEATLAAPVIATVMLAFGLTTAARGLFIKRIPILFQAIHPAAANALSGFKIAQITDLHIGPTIDHNYVQKVVEMTNSVEPDIVVLTGDIGDGDPVLYAKDFAPLKALRAKHRIFYVTGNHEYYSDGKRWIEIMAEMGMQVLLNENQVLKIESKNGNPERSTATLAIAGVLDPASAISNATDGPKPEVAVRGCESADYKILLAHQPGIADRAEKLGFDLQISGHTHGGQFFPWNLVVRKVHQYYQGLFTRNKMHIYVSPGTGTWGPPVRLGTRPEISVLTLIPTSDQRSYADPKY